MSAHHLPLLAQRVFNRPLALLPDKAEVIMAALGDRFGVTRLFHGARPVEMGYALQDPDRAPERAYDVLSSVAVIPVYGTLVSKLGTLRPYSGMTGYDGIRANFLMALNDPDVDAIVFDVDSPGGEVAGMLDLADTIYDARGHGKPIWSILNEEAYSAAYAIASATDRVVVPRTGGTGSVGVIILHADLTQALAKEGVTVTLIRYGAKKFQGSPYEALSSDVRESIQEDADAMGQMFVDLVARNRGLSAAAVAATEADTYRGSKGVEIGFADAVMSPDAAFAALVSSL